MDCNRSTRAVRRKTQAAQGFNRVPGKWVFMKKELCLIHANCQADPVLELLLRHEGFCRYFRVAKYTNYLKEKIPPEQLAQCAVFIYQHLGPKWEELASENLLGLLPPGALVLRLPNMLFKGYWPFWTSRSPSDFGDFYLDKLLDKGLSKAEILHLYLRADLGRLFDLRAMFEESVAVERDKEQGCLCAYVDEILAHYRTEQLFGTINHPRQRLVWRMTQAVLDRLDLAGLPGLNSDAYRQFSDPYPEFSLPIHPQVAAVQELAFIGPDTRFPVFGKLKTFEEYVNNYIDCRLLGLAPFVGYLQVA